MAALQSIHKRITTLFGDKIRFTLIITLLQKKISLYFANYFILGQIFTSLVLNFASI
jgi:hypothetical protein